jgi:hypothetical protein
MARRLPPEARALRLPTIRCPAALFHRARYMTSNASLRTPFSRIGQPPPQNGGPRLATALPAGVAGHPGKNSPPIPKPPGNKTSCDRLSSLRNNHSSSLSATARARHITARRNRSKRYGRRHSQQSPVAIGSPCNALPIISLFMTIVKRFVTHYGIGICSSTAEGPDATRCTAGAMTGTHILWCLPRAGFGAKAAPGTPTHRPNK